MRNLDRNLYIYMEDVENINHEKALLEIKANKLDSDYIQNELKEMNFKIGDIVNYKEERVCLIDFYMTKPLSGIVMAKIKPLNVQSKLKEKEVDILLLYCSKINIKE